MVRRLLPFLRERYELDFGKGKHLTYLDMIGVGADDSLIGLVNLMPFGSIAVVMLGNFGERIATHNGVGVTLGSSGRGGLSRVATKEISSTGSRLGSWLNRFFFAFIEEIK